MNTTRLMVLSFSPSQHIASLFDSLTKKVIMVYRNVADRAAAEDIADKVERNNVEVEIVELEA